MLNNLSSGGWEDIQCKNDLSSVPGTHTEPGAGAHTAIPALRRQRQEGPWGLAEQPV